MDKKSTHGRIVEAADRLFYEQGFEHTSFAQIADVVGISRGNFYYHFKAKDEILDSVISNRIDKTCSMLEAWEAEGSDPGKRIQCFINILIMNRSKIMDYGCPVGTLCGELAKLNHPAQGDANELFTLFHSWLRTQFEALGHADAEMLAMHLLARSQGIATLANAFHDEKFIRQEVRCLNDWLTPYIDRH